MNVGAIERKAKARQLRNHAVAQERGDANFKDRKGLPENKIGSLDGAA